MSDIQRRIERYKAAQAEEEAEGDGEEVMTEG